MKFLRNVALAVAVAMPAAAQDSVENRPGTTLSPRGSGRAAVPFSLGERAEYQVKFSWLSVGSGYMEVAALEPVRGRETWHTTFRVRGGVPGFRVDDRYESWLDTKTLVSLRHHQQLEEGRRERERKFEIYPDSVYVEDERPAQPTVAAPLDDGSFLYFIRTVPLEVGKEYSFDRYFRPDRNPVRVQVLRKERISVPAGSFNTIVIRPIIKSRGVFSENGHAEIWLTDDATRLMVQMKSRLSIGSINLYLKSYRPGVAATDSTATDTQ